MADMLVKLYEIDENRELYRELSEKGIHIKRALGLDASFVCDFIEKEKFSKRWVDECRAAFSAQPSACYIAVKNGEVIGFAATTLHIRIFWDLSVWRKRRESRESGRRFCENVCCP